MKKPVCILFAGPIGSSKTPIANYLSCAFKIPIFSNDSIRKEIIEDFGGVKEKEYKNKYEKQRDERLKALIQRRATFIYDASIDRRWKKLREMLKKANYRHFIVSIDLSMNFLKKLHSLKGYNDSLKYIEQNIKEHEEFVRRYENDINLRINDESFSKRLIISKNALQKWL